MKRYSFTWITMALFLVALVGHWWLAWHAYAADQRALGEAPELAGYLVEVGRDTLENWQSEFLQLAWQVMGLALLYHAGSPQSRGDDERMEAKLDALLRERGIDPEEIDQLIVHDASHNELRVTRQR